jgi:2'-5' RNA ligase
MQYIMHAPLGEPVRSLHRQLVDDIADRFDLRFTQHQAIETHFTVKYHFATDRIAELERLTETFCSSEKPCEVRVDGIGHFAREVIFLEVKPGGSAQQLMKRLFAELRTLDWMQWSQFDAENLHPHATIAEVCGERFDEVMDYLKAKKFDHRVSVERLTILKHIGNDGEISLWDHHRTFELRG